MANLCKFPVCAQFARTKSQQRRRRRQIRMHTCIIHPARVGQMRKFKNRAVRWGKLIFRLCPEQRHNITQGEASAVALFCSASARERWIFGVIPRQSSFSTTMAISQSLSTAAPPKSLHSPLLLYACRRARRKDLAAEYHFSMRAYYARAKPLNISGVVAGKDFPFAADAVRS